MTQTGLAPTRPQNSLSKPRHSWFWREVLVYARHGCISFTAQLTSVLLGLAQDSLYPQWPCCPALGGCLGPGCGLCTTRPQVGVSMGLSGQIRMEVASPPGKAWRLGAGELRRVPGLPPATLSAERRPSGPPGGSLGWWAQSHLHPLELDLSR